MTTYESSAGKTSSEQATFDPILLLCRTIQVSFFGVEKEGKEGGRQHRWTCNHEAQVQPYAMVVSDEFRKQRNITVAVILETFHH